MLAKVNIISPSPPSTQEVSNIRKRRILSRIDSSIGPEIPISIISSIKRDNISVLNLHSNKLYSLYVSQTDHKIVPDIVNDVSEYNTIDLIEIDVSSNYLGENSEDPPENSISILRLAPKLICMNLSSNNLTYMTLSRAFQSIYLPYLEQMNLSHNYLDKLPDEFSKSFPNLNQFNIIGNHFAKYAALFRPLYTIKAKILKLHLKDDVDTNPICSHQNYRHHMICFFAHLKNLDSEHVLGGDHDDAIDAINLFTMGIEQFEEIENIDCTKELDTNNQESPMKSNSNCKKTRMASSSEKSNSIKKNVSQSCKRQVQNKSNKNQDGIIQKSLDRMNTKHTTTVENRIINATQKMSLHKVNSLENKLKALSDVVEKQAATTQNLIQMADMRSQQHKISPRNEESTTVDMPFQSHTVTLKDEKASPHFQNKNITETTCSIDLQTSQKKAHARVNPFKNKNHESQNQEDSTGVFNLQTFILLNAVQKWKLNIMKSKLGEMCQLDQSLLQEKEKNKEHCINLKTLEEKVASAKEKEILLGEAQATISELNEKIEGLERSVHHYLSERKDMKRNNSKNIADLEEENKRELRKRLEIFRRKLKKTLDIERSQHKSSNMLLENECRDIISSAIQERDKAIADMSTLKENLNNETRKRMENEEQLMNLQKNITDKENFREITLKCFDQEVQRVKHKAQSDIEQLKLGFEQTAKRAAVDRANFVRVTADLKNMKLDLENEIKNNLSLRDEIMNMEANLSRCISELQFQEKVNGQNCSSLKEKMDENERLSQESKEKDLHIHRLNMENDRNIDVSVQEKKKVKILMGTIQKREKTNETLAKELRTKNTLLSVLDRKFCDLQECVEGVKTQKDRLRQTKFELEEQTKAAKEMEKRSYDLLTDLKQENKQHKVDKVELETVINRLRNDLASSKELFENREHDFKIKGKTEVAILQKEINILKGECRKLESAKLDFENKNTKLEEQVLDEKAINLKLSQQLETLQNNFKDQQIKTKHALVNLCQNVLSESTICKIG